VYKFDKQIARYNLSIGVVLNVRFTTNGMCANNNTHMCVASTSNNGDHGMWVLFFAHIPFVVNRTFNATPTERLQHNNSQIKIPNLFEFPHILAA